MRDLHAWPCTPRKGHSLGRVTLEYKVTREGHAFRSHSIDFLDPKYIRNKKFTALACIVPEIKRSLISRVTLKYKVTREGHAFLSHSIVFLDPKYIRNKQKIHCSSLYSAQDRKGHSYEVAWPWSTRSRMNFTHVFLTPSTSLTQNTLETKKNSLL